MDIEQLKLVLQTITGLGIETKNAAMLWLAVQLLSTVLKLSLLAKPPTNCKASSNIGKLVLPE